jgi:hypothetical protein
MREKESQVTKIVREAVAKAAEKGDKLNDLIKGESDEKG